MDKMREQMNSSKNWYKKAIFGNRPSIEPEGYAWGYIHPNMLYDLYRLEYKISKIVLKAEYLTHYVDDDRYYRYYHKLVKKLQPIVDELVDEFMDFFVDFIDYHLQAEGMLGEDWLERYRPWVMDAYVVLREAQNSGDMWDKIKALNIAKNITHGGFKQKQLPLVGLHIYQPISHGRTEPEYISSEGAQGFYDALSRDVFHEQWDKEFEQFASSGNWHKQAFLPSNEEFVDSLEADDTFRFWAFGNYDSDTKYELAETYNWAQEHDIDLSKYSLQDVVYLMDAQEISSASSKNWYKQAAPPYVSEVKSRINEVGDAIKAIPHVEAVYVFGSYAKSVGDPHKQDYFMKDLDVVAQVDFYFGDMQSCIVGDEFGFDEREDCQEAREFTNRFISMYSNFNMDPWVITGDGELLHWGPLVDSDEEFGELQDIAYETAFNITGISLEDYGFDPDDIDDEEIEAIEDEDVREKIREFVEFYQRDLSRYVNWGMSEGTYGWYSFGKTLTTQDVMTEGVQIA